MIAFLDACVLYPATLRDVLLTLSAGGLFEIKWSPDVLDEMERNLIRDGRANGNVRTIMEDAFKYAMVDKSQYSTLIPQMENHPKDRHVLAAAITCQADVLVTANLKDFQVLPIQSKTSIQHPEDFLLDLLHDSPRELIECLEEMTGDRHYPLNTVPGIINSLHPTVPNFVTKAFDVYMSL